MPFGTVTRDVDSVWNRTSGAFGGTANVGRNDGGDLLYGVWEFPGIGARPGDGIVQFDFHCGRAGIVGAPQFQLHLVAALSAPAWNPATPLSVDLTTDFVDLPTETGNLDGSWNSGEDFDGSLVDAFGEILDLGYAGGRMAAVLAPDLATTPGHRTNINSSTDPGKITYAYNHIEFTGPEITEYEAGEQFTVSVAINDYTGGTDPTKTESCTLSSDLEESGLGELGAFDENGDLLVTLNTPGEHTLTAELTQGGVQATATMTITVQAVEQEGTAGIASPIEHLLMPGLGVGLGI